MLKFIAVVTIIALLFSGNVVAALVLAAVAWLLLSGGKEKTPSAIPSPEKKLYDTRLFDLLALNWELRQRRRDGEISEQALADLEKRIAEFAKQELGNSFPYPHNAFWLEHCERAWDRLNATSPEPLGAPPWRKPAATAQTAPDIQPPVQPAKPEPIVPPASAAAQPATIEKNPIPPLSQAHPPYRQPVKPEAIVQPTLAATHTTVIEKTAAPPLSQPQSLQPQPPKPPQHKPEPAPPPRPEPIAPPKAESSPAIAQSPAPTEPAGSKTGAALPLQHSATAVNSSLQPSVAAQQQKSAWRPAAPSKLEVALQAISGWPRIVIPFLVQNIGWFIGGFCFVGGSIFLVTYTSGFGKALAVFLTLLVYSALLTWGGYQLRSRRPELRISSQVLLTLGILLIPLITAAAARMLIAASGWLVIVAVLLVLLSSAAMFFALHLAAGVIDRRLAHAYPGFLLVLSAVQLTLPLLEVLPYWQAIAVLHVLLLAGLAYALVLFADDWLQSIFVERVKIAYHAGGTLLFAGLVSFFHLTWGMEREIALPAGYYGPFLMLLCCVLFYLDARFKRWTAQQPFLSKFSFALYGLSIVALLLAAGQVPPLLLTLAIGLCLYSFIVWNYLSFVPLYLFFGCSVWLYDLLLLRFLPYDSYLLASLPGLWCLERCNRWALRKRSPLLALVAYRTLGVLLAALTVWSLALAKPGLLASISALAAAALLYRLLGSTPAMLFQRIKQEAPRDYWADIVDLRDSRYFYAVTVLLAVAAAFAPQWPGLSAWPLQTALLWLGLAAILTQLALARSWPNEKAEVYVNSIALLLLASAWLAMQADDLKALRALIFFGAGALWWRLGLKLYVKPLIYAALLMWAVTGSLLHDPAKSAALHSLAKLLPALLAWGYLWHLQRRAEIETLLRGSGEKFVEQPAPYRLLGVLQLPGPTLGNAPALLRGPLQQAFTLLWLLAVFHLLEGHKLFGAAWSAAAIGTALLTLLLAGHYRLLPLLPLAFLLGLGSCAAAVYNAIGAPPAALACLLALAALLLWHGVLKLLRFDFTLRVVRFLYFHGGYGNEGGRAKTERLTRRFALTVIAGAVVYAALLAPPFGSDLRATAFAVMTWLISAYFFWQCAQRLRTAVYGYLTSLTLPALALTVYAALRGGMSMAELAAEPSFSMVLASIGMLSWLIACLLDYAVAGDDSFDQSCFRKPLRGVALVLAYAAGMQALLLSFTTVTAAGDLGLALAGVMALAANHRLKLNLWDFPACLALLLAILWMPAWLLHSGDFSLAYSSGHDDLWPLLGFLALATEWLARRRMVTPHYRETLLAVAYLAYGWCLLGTSLLYLGAPPSGGWHLPAAFAMLAYGLYPLLRDTPHAAVYRGWSVPLLLSGAITGAALQMPVASASALAVWAFVMLLGALYLLPRLNERFPPYATEARIWPWYGLVLIGAIGLWHGSSGFIALNLLYVLLWWQKAGRSRDAPIASGESKKTISNTSVDTVALLVTLIGIAMQAALVAPFGNAEPAGLSVLFGAATAACYLGWSGLHYRDRLRSYLLLSLLMLALPIGYARLSGISQLGLLSAEPMLGFCATLLACSFGAAARGLALGVSVTTGLLRDLYRIPLLIFAAALACFTIVQQFLLADAGVTLVSTLILGFSAVTLLLVERALPNLTLLFAALAAAVITVLWCEALAVHGGKFSLWPTDLQFADFWLTLSMVACGLNSVDLAINWQLHRRARRARLEAGALFEPRQRRARRALRVASTVLACGLHVFDRLPAVVQQRYHAVLSWLSGICYWWALAGAVTLFAVAPLHGNLYLSASLLLLCLMQPLRLQTFEQAPLLRGVMVPLLASAVLVNLLGLAGLAAWLEPAAFVWAFTLCSAAAYALPSFNRRFPEQAIAYGLWPWLGFACIVAALGDRVAHYPAVLPEAIALAWGLRLDFALLSQDLQSSELAWQLSAAAAYLLFMMRIDTARLLPWLAVVCLQYAGVLAIESLLLSEPFDSADLGVLTAVCVPVLLWCDLLLCAVPLFKRYPGIAAVLRRDAGDLAAACAFWPLTLLLPMLAGVALRIVPADAGGIILSGQLSGVFLLLLAASCFAAFWVKQNAWRAHGFIAASLICFAALGGNYFAPPVWLALWALAAAAVIPAAARYMPALAAALSIWRPLTPCFALVGLTFGASPADEIFALLLIAAAFALSAAQAQSRGWLYSALIITIALMHRWPLLLWSGTSVLAALPWFALQLALLAWTIELASRHVALLTQTRRGMLMIVSVFAISEWLLHLYTAFAAPVLPDQAAAALLAGLLLLGLGIKNLHGNYNSPLMYALAAAVAAMAAYGRLLLFGKAPLSSADTALILAGVLLLSGVQYFIVSLPLRRLSVVLPLAALATAPPQLASQSASACLFVVGALYLLQRRLSGAPLPLYLAFLAFNAAIYLWVPQWVQASNLLQLYIIPAALSVLALLHLHRRELRPEVLSGGRLAASSTLYAGVTLDVFLTPAFSAFLLAMALSFAGIVTGIALRIRAFLYAGTSFLVLNIVGQLIRHYPENTFGKAIFLMTVGALILGLMIWFNLKREEVMQRIRIFRADLAAWE